MTTKVFRTFRPSVGRSVVLLLLMLLFASLGVWQTQRAAHKAVLEQQFHSARSMPLAKALQSGLRFTHIEASGRYDRKRHILLDNQIWRGRAGVHVFTPFYLSIGGAILVNRGWLPLAADRKHLPDIATPTRSMTLHGIVNSAPVPGRKLGAADPLDREHWPQLVTYLNIADISKAIGTTLDAQIIQLSASETAGFSGRDWQPVYLTSRRHRGYAFQWFAMALATLGLWVFTGFRNKP